MRKNQTIEAPEIDVIRFSVRDIIATSGAGGGIVLPDDEWE